jgi:hypothetical protein
MAQLADQRPSSFGINGLENWKTQACPRIFGINGLQNWKTQAWKL